MFQSIIHPGAISGTLVGFSNGKSEDPRESQKCLMGRIWEFSIIPIFTANFPIFSGEMEVREIFVVPNFLIFVVSDIFDNFDRSLSSVNIGNAAGNIEIVPDMYDVSE